MTDQEKLIWAAGFLDGEGYVSVTRAKSRFGPGFHYRGEISAAQVHPAPLIVLVELFGGIVKTTRSDYGPHFYWRLYCKKAAAAIERLLPYFVAKKQQASLVLEFDSLVSMRGKGFRYLPEDVIPRKEALFAALKQLNQRRTRAERLNEGAPTDKTEGDAIVRSHGNKNHENVVEIATSQRAV